ncbi:MAG: alpha/beta hydrolase, partial [bacterium]
PNSRPVLFFHGIPGSRLQRNPDMTSWKELSICVYALDRPGTGLSTYKKNRTLLEYPDDVRTFCDSIIIETIEKLVTDLPESDKTLLRQP